VRSRELYVLSVAAGGLPQDGYELETRVDREFTLEWTFF
jgi:hypothetical protein